ncbi:hypothetical protein QTG56_23920 (plasmid) [Rossellomorea sp. AcN35-11]|nr:hypothetical protein [Rossellomorea aquimaris]WJV31686.1 hypothetical protein QTG56_23920 [Rossellomorea sp. AcN35-11]
MNNIVGLIRSHVFKEGDPVLIGGEKEIPGIIVDASELQLKVKLYGTYRHVYTTRSKEFTKPDLKRIYGEQVWMDETNSSVGQNKPEKVKLEYSVPLGNDLEQLLLF